MGWGHISEPYPSIGSGWCSEDYQGVQARIEARAEHFMIFESPGRRALAPKEALGYWLRGVRGRLVRHHPSACADVWLQCAVFCVLVA